MKTKKVKEAEKIIQEVVGDHCQIISSEKAFMLFDRCKRLKDISNGNK